MSLRDYECKPDVFDYCTGELRKKLKRAREGLDAMYQLASETEMFAYTPVTRMILGQVEQALQDSAPEEEKEEDMKPRGYESDCWTPQQVMMDQQLRICALEERVRKLRRQRDEPRKKVGER